MLYRGLRRIGQAVALVTTVAFLAACSKNEVRSSVEVEHYSVDWDHVSVTPVQASPLELRGIVLSPAQWPLETSFKRALHGDFKGMIDGFNLSFQSSHIPSGVLEDLYDAGYVAVYARVANTSDAPAQFFLTSLVIRDSAGAELSPVDPADLPAAFKQIDWAKTGKAIALTALVVVIIIVAVAAGGRGVNLSGSGNGFGGGSSGTPTVRPEGRAAGDEGADAALLRAEMIQPHSAGVGIVFFRRSDATFVDWTTAALTVR